MVLQLCVDTTRVLERSGNTAQHEMVMEDENLGHEELEWLLDKSHVTITGVSVKRLMRYHWKTQ